MHTHETDGTSSIREMAEAAIARGLRYIAITDHSKNLAMTNGMDDARALAHAARIRAGRTPKWRGRIRIFPGIEVDILGDGELDSPTTVPSPRWTSSSPACTPASTSPSSR